DFDRVTKLVAEDRDRIVRRAAPRELDPQIAKTVRRRQHEEPSLEGARQTRDVLDVHVHVALLDPLEERREGRRVGVALANQFVDGAIGGAYVTRGGVEEGREGRRRR